jgi:hypothetical protein
MRGLTNEERSELAAAAAPTMHFSQNDEAIWSLLNRGLLHSVPLDSCTYQLVPTAEGHLALRLDAAARAGTGVPAA